MLHAATAPCVITTVLGSCVSVALWDRHRLTLLVVPPEAAPDVAQHALRTAAGEGNTDDSTHLLAARGTPAERSRPLPA